MIALKLTDSVTEIATDSIIEQKDESQSYHSHHSHSSGDSKTDIISPPLRSQSHPQSHPQSRPQSHPQSHPQSRSNSSKFTAESMMECKLKELNEMIHSIATLKRSYLDQMKTKRVKCT